MPTELLQLIFKRLRWRDLARLTLTCRQFNEIISDNSELLKNVCLLYRFKETENAAETEHLQVTPSLNRRYTKVRISSCSDEGITRFQDIFEDYLENIRSISIGAFNNTFNFSTFIKLLQNCTNLKHLDISDMYNDFNDKFNERPSLRLDSLHICMTKSKVLKCFERTSVKFLRLDRCSEFSLLKSFLSNQHELKTLELIYFNAFNELVAENASYSLENLILDGCKITSDFAGFLANHRESLKKISIKGQVASSAIDSLRFLKGLALKLEISNGENDFTRGPEISINHSIVDLTISSNCEWDVDLSVLDEKLPKLKHLKLIAIRGFKPWKSFDQLESLALGRIIIEKQLLISRVKKLEFDCCSFRMIPPPFNFDRHSITDLRVHNCYFSAWSYQFLQHSKTQLNSLHLYNPIGTSEKEIAIRLKAFNDNKHKVKRLKFNHYYPASMKGNESLSQ